MRGRVVLIARLAFRDLRRRQAEAALLLLAIVAATGTLTLGFALSGVTSSPYAKTKAETAGPDVTVQSAGAARDGGAPAYLTSLERAPGVRGYSGPYPVVTPVLRAAGHTVPGDGFSVVGRDQGRALIDQPELTAGRWVRPGGVVVEVTYAAELGVQVGDRITLGGRPFTVTGLAVTAAWPSVNAPGLMWLTRADAMSLISKADPVSYLLNLKLAHPASATAFVNARGNASSLFFSSWQQISSQDSRQLQQEQMALVVGSWLLSLLAIASVAVLVGGRMAEQTRRVGLLKAVGATPALVAVALLAENLALALLAAVLGLAGHAPAG
jgi:ABC-type lipoprotein release transport system permease subunit